MTFNVLAAGLTGNPGLPPAPPWETRRPLVAELLRAEVPDLLGVQEATAPRQVKDLQAALPGHARIGAGRDADGRGETNALFVRRERFEVAASGQFWLSPTPEAAGSLAFHAAVPRIATWARLRERGERGASDLLFVNTHLDYESAASRRESARFLRGWIERESAGRAVVLTGDFNAAAPRDPEYRVFTGDGAFRDAWREERDGPATTPTFHGCADALPGAQRIDWILLAGPITSLACGVVAFERGGVRPSDHHPVRARLAFGADA